MRVKSLAQGLNASVRGQIRIRTRRPDGYISRQSSIGSAVICSGCSSATFGMDKLGCSSLKLVLFFHLRTSRHLRFALSDSPRPQSPPPTVSICSTSPSVRLFSMFSTSLSMAASQYQVEEQRHRLHPDCFKLPHMLRRW